MYASRIRAAGLAVAASLGLSACATYGGFGHSGVSVGMGSGGYYDPYYGGGYGYDRYGYGYGSGGYGYPAYGYGYGSGYPGGWYNGYYYPGSGYYVYRDGRRQRWSREQRQHFENLRQRWHERAAGQRGGQTVQRQQSRVIDRTDRQVRDPRRVVRREVREERQVRGRPLERSDVRSRSRSEARSRGEVRSSDE